MKRIMIVFGTRPEAIKMCPLINELKSRAGINVRILSKKEESVSTMLHISSVRDISNRC